MANDIGAIEIPIIVKGDNEIKAAVTTVSRLERELVRAVKAINNGTMSQNRFNQTLAKAKQEYKAYAGNTGLATININKLVKSQTNAIAITKAESQALNQYRQARREATAANQRFDADRAKSIKAARDATVEEERLRNKYVEGHTAMTIYSRELNDLAMARGKDIISADQQKQAVEQLSMAMARGTGAFANVGSAVKNLNNSQMAATKSNNRMGVVVQQTGYQVGDFLVQIQSGTNPMVAFGQQATQLVGVLPLMATQLGISTAAAIGLSTALGIGIPLLTAIGAVFMRSRQSAEEASDGVSNLSAALQRVRGASGIAGSSIADLREEYGDFAEQVQRTSAIVIRAALSDSVREYKNAAAQLSPALQGVRVAIEGVAGAQAYLNRTTQAQTAGFATDEQVLVAAEALELYQGLLEDATSSLGLTAAQAVVLTSSLDAIGEASGPEEMARQAGLALDQFTNILNTIPNMPPALADVIEALDTMQREAANTTVSVENINRKFFEGNELLEEGRRATLDRNRVNRQTIIDLESEISLLNVVAQYGRESVEFVRARATQEGIAKNLTEENLEKYVELSLKAWETSNLISQSAENAGNLAGALREAVSAMSSLQGFSDGLGRALAVSVAQVNALRTGADAAIAGQITGMRLDLNTRMTAATTAGVDRGIVERMFGGDRDLINQIEESETQRKALEDAARSSGSTGGGGGGGSSNVVDINQILAQRREQIEQERTLLLLTGRQREEKEIYFELLKSNSTATIKLSETELMVAVQLEAAERARNSTIEEQIALQEQLAKTIESSMENALMSMVDGTKSVKDAFKSMAAEIIKELYRVLVVQRIVGSASAGTGIAGSIATLFGGISPNANGNAFSGGNIVPFANGGVVGGPSMFPMSGGKTGLMGEAGPEAIMPLKRDKNGRLGVSVEGGSGSVNVTNNINVTGGSDPAAIRMEVAKLMPQITSATKAAVIDARRRGGQMRAAFSS